MDSNSADVGKKPFGGRCVSDLNPVALFEMVLASGIQ